MGTRWQMCNKVHSAQFLDSPCFLSGKQSLYSTKGQPEHSADRGPAFEDIGQFWQNNLELCFYKMTFLYTCDIYVQRAKSQC